MASFGDVRSPNWIWADSTDYSNGNNDTLFWPVKVNDNTIALRNVVVLQPRERQIFVLMLHAVATITREARLQVEELVFDRYLLDVIYRLDDARIFDERPIVAGRGSAENESIRNVYFNCSIGLRMKKLGLILLATVYL